MSGVYGLAIPYLYFHCLIVGVKGEKLRETITLTSDHESLNV